MSPQTECDRLDDDLVSGSRFERVGFEALSSAKPEQAVIAGIASRI